MEHHKTQHQNRPRPSCKFDPPVRVQLSRKKGWRKPENTVVVSRPSIFGNPFWKGYGCRMTAAWNYQCAVQAELFAMRLGIPALNPYFRRIAENLPKLRGKNLACWCSTDLPDDYCHAGKLLALVNVKGEMSE